MLKINTFINPLCGLDKIYNNEVLPGPRDKAFLNKCLRSKRAGCYLINAIIQTAFVFILSRLNNATFYYECLIDKSLLFCVYIS